MKKTLLISAVLLCVPVVALAQGFVALAPIPGLTEGAATDSKNLALFFNNLYKYLIGLAAVLAVIEIIWGGLEISTKDSVSKQHDGKERITQAIFGLVLVLSPVLVFSIINPSILNLSLNLPKLDTAPTITNRPTCDSSLPASDPNSCAAVQATLNNAQQQGLLNLTPEQQQNAVQAGQVVQQTATNQANTCTQNGGKVYRIIATARQDNQCLPIELMQAQRDGYTICTVLVDGSVCLSK